MRKATLQYAVPLVPLLAILLISIFLAVSAQQATATSSPQISSPAHTSAVHEPNTVGSTQTTADGLSVTLKSISKHNSRWLLHFELHNLNARSNATVIGSSDIHQFVIVGKTGPTTVVNKILNAPLASEAKAGYTPLQTTLKGNGVSDGWLAIDTATLGFTPVQVLYRYQAHPTLACINPLDRSTCHNDTLYSALIWSLS